MEYAEASYIVDEDVIDTNAVANPITVVVAHSIYEEERQTNDSLEFEDQCIICLMCFLCPCVLVLAPCSR